MSMKKAGNSLAVQWLELCASTAGGLGLTPGLGTKILHAQWYSQKKKERRKEIKKALNLHEASKQLKMRCLPISRTLERAPP